MSKIGVSCNNAILRGIVWWIWMDTGIHRIAILENKRGRDYQENLRSVPSGELLFFIVSTLSVWYELGRAKLWLWPIGASLFTDCLPPAIGKSKQSLAPNIAMSVLILGNIWGVELAIEILGGSNSGNETLALGPAIVLLNFLLGSVSCHLGDPGWGWIASLVRLANAWSRKFPKSVPWLLFFRSSKGMLRESRFWCWAESWTKAGAVVSFKEGIPYVPTSASKLYHVH